MAKCPLKTLGDGWYEQPCYHCGEVLLWSVDEGEGPWEMRHVWATGGKRLGGLCSRCFRHHYPKLWAQAMKER
jgi:hypothetical protein